MMASTSTTSITNAGNTFYEQHRRARRCAWEQRIAAIAAIGAASPASVASHSAVAATAAAAALRRETSRCNRAGARIHASMDVHACAWTRVHGWAAHASVSARRLGSLIGLKCLFCGSGGLSVHQQPLERCLLACWVKRYFTGE